MRVMDLVITIVGAKDLPLVKRNRPHALVRLTAGQLSAQNTRVYKKSTEPVWGKEILLKGVGDSSLLLFQVFHSRFKYSSLFGETNLGIATIKVDELLEKQKESSENVVLPLTAGVLIVRARCADGHSFASADMATGNEVPNAMDQVVRSLNTTYLALDVLSEIHPYLKLTLQTSISVLKLLNGFRSDADVKDKLLHLLHLMRDMYARVEYLGPLESMHPRLQESVRQILILTTECSLFIQACCTQSKLATRLNSTLTIRKIDEFDQAFRTLGHSLETGLTIQTSVTIENLEWLGITRTFLNPVEMDWSDRQMCLPHTRSEDLDFVSQWLFSQHPQTMLWIRGMAGCGKSTLSTTLANFCTQLHRLGAFLFFDRDRERHSDPRQVFRTLAYQLGLYDSQIARAIQKAIHDNPHIVNAPLSSQFHQLVRQPLEELPDTGPIIIILDALDECVVGPAHSELVSILSKEASTLPSFVRIVITSRNEPYIRRPLEDRDHVEIRDIGVATDDDISIFMQRELEDIRLRHGLAEGWPDPAHVSALVQRASGLFIWANTACRWIDGHHNPERSVMEIVDGHSADVGLSLDALYSSILSNAGPWEDEDFGKDFQAIMGFLLLVSDPVAPKTIDTILAVDALRLLSRFQSVLHCKMADDPVHIIHITFRDYLQDKGRCGDKPWYIDTDRHHRELAKKTNVIQNIFAEDK